MKSSTSSLERLKALVTHAGGRFSVAEAALTIATHQYPDLDVASYLERLDAVALRLRRRLPEDAGRVHVIGILNHFLFEELGYSGNGENYYDPRNSFLNDVIERRLGIPITLSILYMEIGQRLGLRLAGVSFPGHFLVKCAIDRGIVVLDPFNAGMALSEEELRRRLARQLGNAYVDAAPISPYLQTAENAEIIARLLRNLKSIYLEAKHLTNALAMANMLLVIQPGSLRERRERGLIHYQLECYHSALQDLEHYQQSDPAAGDDETLREVLIELRRRDQRFH
jgi:regulator of sirC expression with transglutaminase-like and TPR domain